MELFTDLSDLNKHLFGPINRWVSTDGLETCQHGVGEALGIGQIRSLGGFLWKQWDGIRSVGGQGKRPCTSWLVIARPNKRVC